MIGTQIVEIDTRADLEAALAGPVAMVALLGTHEHLASIRMNEIIEVTKPRGIPVLVDAASEHLEAPSPWLARGADLVVYSGGKFLRGPQTSGLLLGRKDLVQAAWRNASPHQALGRPMNVSKEDIVGLLTAVESWFGERDHAAERRTWRDDLATIADALNGLAATEIIEPTGVERVPRLHRPWQATRGLHGNELRRMLLDGEPRIVLDDMSATAQSIAVDPFSLQPGEALLVGQAMAAALRRAPGAASAVDAAPLPRFAGAWELRVTFLHGERVHRMWLDQDGASLQGRHESAEFDGIVQGTVTSGGVRFGLGLRYQGTNIAYQFEGHLRDGGMEGDVVLGSSTD